MSAHPSDFLAIPSSEPSRKRKHVSDDDSEIYDSNGKTRRVNPYKLGERLGADLVREMEVYIKPGATMPNFAIRKELQERYQVDRRHLYDYFHSRGLRVAKEDRHSNLTRSRQAKAVAVNTGEGNVSTSRKTPSASGSKPSSTQKKPKASKTVRPALAQGSANVSFPSTAIAKTQIVQTHEEEDNSRVLTWVYAHEPSCISPIQSPEPIRDDLQAEIPTPVAENVDIPIIELPFVPSLADASSITSSPSSINNWLAEKTSPNSITWDASAETTLVEDEAGLFSPAEFVKQTIDSLNFNYDTKHTLFDQEPSFNYDEFIKFDEDDPSLPTGSPCARPTSLGTSDTAIPERKTFYDLVNNTLTVQEVEPERKQPAPAVSSAKHFSVFGGSLSHAQTEESLPQGSVSSPAVSVATTLALQKSHQVPMRNTDFSPFCFPNSLQTPDRCGYNDGFTYRSDKFFVQTLSSQQNPYLYKGYTALPPTRLRAISAGGGI